MRGKIINLQSQTHYEAQPKSAVLDALLSTSPQTEGQCGLAV